MTEAPPCSRETSDAHLAIGNEVVAEKDEERVAVDLVGSLEDGVAKTAGLVLIDERNGKRRGLVDAGGLCGLATLAQR